MKAYALIKLDADGGPDIGLGWSRCAKVEGNLPGNFAIFCVVASGAQLVAIQAMANCIFGLAVTSDGITRFPELDNAVPVGIRTKINTYLTARGLATIPAGTTLLQVIRRVKANWDFGDTDCWDG